MGKRKEFSMEKLIESFENFKEWNSSLMEEVAEMLLKNIFSDPGSSKVAVTVSPTDDVGMYDHIDVYIFDSYVNALDLINKYEYTINVAVNVAEINYRGYAEMLYKIFDSNNYSRLADVKFVEYNLSCLRKLFDTNANIYEVA